MKKSLKIAFLLCLMVFSWQSAMAEIVEEDGEFIVVSKVNPLKDSKEEQSLPQNLPLPKNIKIVSNLTFGGRFYLHEDDDDSLTHFPIGLRLELYSPYADWHARNAPNELDFSLEQGIDRAICQKKLPYVLSISGMIQISELEFAKHTVPVPSIGLLWFDNGVSVPLNSDATNSYTYGSGKVVPKKDFFWGVLNRYRASLDPESLDYKQKRASDAFITHGNEHQAALLFQKHLPIALSYGDYAVSFTYPDPAPIKEFQKQLNNSQRLKENVAFVEASRERGSCYRYEKDMEK
ncbi:hypothetical protein FAI40_04715 [Acetobacteraceae bacterium]|nr:hypothetical protein FAI40_04715 [Acetobacteraceae bacterium]